MKNKSAKLINVFCIILFVFLYIPIIVNATVAGVNVGNGANSTVVNAGKNILGIAQIIGVGVASIMLIALAIKYIVSSPSDKAEIKKHAVVYIVGAIFIYAAAGILKIIQVFAEGMGK